MKSNNNKHALKKVFTITFLLVFIFATTVFASGQMWSTFKLHTEVSSRTFTFWGDESSVEFDFDGLEPKPPYQSSLESLKDSKISLTFDKDILKVLEGDPTATSSYSFVHYTIIVPSGTSVTLSYTPDVYLYNDDLLNGESRTLSQTTPDVISYNLGNSVNGINVSANIKILSNPSVTSENVNSVYPKSEYPKPPEYEEDEDEDEEYSYNNSYSYEEDNVYETASPISSHVLVNGKEITFSAYNIGGNNYFKLRDLAMALNGTDKDFSVAWDEQKNAIVMTSGVTYTPVGGELESGNTSGNAKALISSSSLYKDNQKVSVDAYIISGNTYFKLRDIGQLFHFGVNWNEINNSIEITT